MNTIAMRRLGDTWKMSWGTHSNKGSVRPPVCLQKHPDHKRHLYWWRFLTELLHDKLIINIDEAGFSKSVKTSYSWLPIGSDASIVNEVFGGRKNLILAVSQFGDWIGIINNKTTKSFDYCLFMAILIKIIGCAGYDIKTQDMFIQD